MSRVIALLTACICTTPQFARYHGR